MGKTKIEWADMTINPIVGCTKCSPGCRNCYAEKMAMRLAGHSGKLGERYQSVVRSFSVDRGWNGKVDADFRCLESLPRRPSRIFVGSMGDVFHDAVSHDQIDTLLNLLSNFPSHTFMLLTKRPMRMRDAVNSLNKRWLTNVLPPADIATAPRNVPSWPIPNVWLGVTVCNQAEADQKIPLLLSTPAAKRFVSIEPMLGPLKVTPFIGSRTYHCACGWHDTERDLFLVGEQAKCHNCGKLVSIHPAVDWVICGAETGPGARPMDPAWAQSMRDQCQEAGVPFFFKKMAGNAPVPDDLMVREWPE